MQRSGQAGTSFYVRRGCGKDQGSGKGHPRGIAHLESFAVWNRVDVVGVGDASLCILRPTFVPDEVDHRRVVPRHVDRQHLVRTGRIAVEPAAEELAIGRVVREVDAAALKATHAAHFIVRLPHRMHVEPVSARFVQHVGPAELAAGPRGEEVGLQGGLDRRSPRQGPTPERRDDDDVAVAGPEVLRPADAGVGRRLDRRWIGRGTSQALDRQHGHQHEHEKIPVDLDHGTAFRAVHWRYQLSHLEMNSFICFKTVRAYAAVHFIFRKNQRNKKNRFCQDAWSDRRKGFFNVYYSYFSSMSHLTNILNFL